jgi:hypothetical protein
MKTTPLTKTTSPIYSAESVMPFGQYRGLTLGEIAEQDENYILWLRDQGIIRIDRRFCDYVEVGGHITEH